MINWKNSRWKPEAEGVGKQIATRPTSWTIIKPEAKAIVASGKHSAPPTADTIYCMLDFLKEKQLLEMTGNTWPKPTNTNPASRNSKLKHVAGVEVISNSRVVDRPWPVSASDPKIDDTWWRSSPLSALCRNHYSERPSPGKMKIQNEIEKMTSIPIISEIACKQNPLVIEGRPQFCSEFRKRGSFFPGNWFSHKENTVNVQHIGKEKLCTANLAVNLSWR